jgi:hypothetical protein
MHLNQAIEGRDVAAVSVGSGVRRHDALNGRGHHRRLGGNMRLRRG